MSRGLAVALAFAVGAVWGAVVASVVRLAMDTARRRPLRAAILATVGMAALAVPVAWAVGWWLA